MASSKLPQQSGEGWSENDAAVEAQAVRFLVAILMQMMWAWTEGYPIRMSIFPPGKIVAAQLSCDVQMSLSPSSH